MKPALLMFFAILGAFLLALIMPTTLSAAQDSTISSLITGIVVDSQKVAVDGASVELVSNDNQETISQISTQTDGRFTLSLNGALPDRMSIRITREHFKESDIQLNPDAIQKLKSDETVVLPETILIRRITLAFWVATLIFIGMLVLIAMGRLHNTLAALVGASAVFAVSYLGRPITQDLYIFGFRAAIQYVDWNVIFLIMGMMIVIAVVERTGMFQWLAFNAYRVSRGRIWLLMPILMLVTGLVSAALDNVTTMLLMTPITIQISLAIGLNPLVLLMPEVLASNIAGISTLIGTPTNILIGSFGKISFNSFLINQTPGILLALLGLILYCEWIYRREIQATTGEGIASELMQRLEERGRITQPGHLKKVGIVGAGMLLLFVFGESLTWCPP